MFETVLRMAVAGSPASDRRWRSLPVSFALHGVVIATVALLSVRTLTDSPEPDAPIVFLQGNAPPPPLGDSFSALQRPQRDDAVIPATLMQPQEVPNETDPRLASTDTPAPERGDDPSEQSPAGDPNGRKNGSSSGLPDSDGREGPRAGDSERPLLPGGDVTEPRLLHRVEPAYSETERKLHLEGVVVLKAIISDVGGVEEVRVVKSVPPLDAEAVRAISLWRYRPATLNGRPVRVYLTVTVEFKLR